MATHSTSCLENPRDGGAWWAAVYGVAQSRTRLKRLSSSSIPKYFIIFIAMVNGIVSLISVFPLLCTAAAATKPLQSCPTLCDPIDSSPPGSPVPGDRKSVV